MPIGKTDNQTFSRAIVGRLEFVKAGEDTCINDFENVGFNDYRVNK
jgi:hypothetical protein